MKQEADKFFLEGVNQFIGHGWPYSLLGIAEPGWAFYAAASFNDHNPWFGVMPDVTRYLQRVSWLLRQGEPANDVAVFVPTDDLWASFRPGHASLTELMPEYMTPELTAGILDAGYNFDYIDSAAIDKLGIRYPVLVLPKIDRLSLSTYRQLEKYLQQGGKIIAVGSLPEHAPGLKDQGDTGAIHELTQKLFGSSGPGTYVKDIHELSTVLKKASPPDMQLAISSSAVGFIHRRLPDADIYFVANTGNEDVQTKVAFRSKHRTLEQWDPFVGESVQVKAESIPLHLAPYESAVFVFHDGPAWTKKSASNSTTNSVLLGLSDDWKVRFLGSGKAETMHSLVSWTDDPETLYYSGEASYEKDFDLTKKGSAPIVLDFGEGKALPIVTTNKPGTRAWLEAPVRDAAQVFVNGRLAGYVWHPPFRLDITSLLKNGRNHIEIRVANTAINTWAGHSLTDYRLLNSRYGERFVPQDVENMQPLPSGILGNVQLVTVK
jgi:hypothetical protein